MTASSPLLTRNRKAFATRQPDVLRRMLGAVPVGLDLAYRDGVLTDLMVAPDQWLYGGEAGQGDGRQVARTQLAEWRSDPDIIAFPDPADAQLKGPVAAFRDRMRTPAGETGGQSPEGGYGFLFGLGLGHHLSGVLAETTARHLIIIEPYAGLLTRSLEAIDWAALFERAESRSIALTFVLEEEPEAIVRALEQVLNRERMPVMLDGAFAHLHYPAWALVEARRLFNDRVRNFLIRPNTFMDEAIMLRHSLATLRSAGLVDARLVTREPRPDPGLPALIVGSGPSLDLVLDRMAELAERAVVISCGSALGVLLKRGIRPCIHIENENTEPLVNNLRDFQAAYGFEGITLACSTTVDPRVPAFFATCLLYFREALSPAGVLGYADRALPHSGPLVGNAATTVALALGFRHILFAGVDCGKREGAGHHAADSVYNQEDYDNYLPDSELRHFEKQLVRKVPANFGGEAVTSSYYDLSRRTLTEALRQAGAEADNMSDGARIDGARAKAVSALKLAPPPRPPRQALAAQVALLARVGDLGGVLGQRLDEALVGLAAYREGLDDAFVGAGAAGSDLWRLCAELTRLRRPEGGLAPGLDRMLGSSLDWMARFGLWRAARLRGRERAELLEAFLADYETETKRLIDEAETLLRSLRA
ncbi:MAG: 6-hydroxymethylpterin diphosphokinase MptE-like protein [Rhodospirillales bacterium]